MAGKKWNRTLLVAVVAIVASLVSASIAFGASGKEYQLTVEPPVVVDGVAATFTVTVKNLDNNVLGAVEITPPTGFGNISVGNPSPGTWSKDLTSAPGKIRLIANSQDARLGLGQTVSVPVTATPPSADGQLDDSDNIVTWSSEGRQANNFNSGGNDFFQKLGTERSGDYVYRPGGAGGVQARVLLTYETLVVSGDLVDCTAGPCKGSDSQSGVQVDITLLGCTVGSLVVDATDLFPADDPIAIAGFYHYLTDASSTGSCIGASTAVIHFVYPKDLGVKTGELGFKAYYGGKLSGYVDGTPLESCKKVSINCVDYVKGGKDGVEAQLILPVLASDPGGIAFR
jgi:hypothetical protein